MEIRRVAKLVQCIPNFSEGRRPEVVRAIVDAIAGASGVRVVDYSMDTDHHRSVVTFLGEPGQVRQSVLAGAKAAMDLIDLNKHKGGHPRVGAIDVVPVVPIHEMTMADAVALSYEIGKELADTLRLPVYFYERSAIMGHRENLAVVRKGGFEALMKSGLTGEREPDLGPSELHPTAGAVIVGARGPLIAFNVNLATHDIHIARTIAAKIRKLRDYGQGMPGVKAIAVYLKSRNIAQVSTNITLPHRVSIYDVYAFIAREAKAMGVETLESELIGAIRQESLIESAKSSMKLHGMTEKRVLDWWMK